MIEKASNGFLSHMLHSRHPLRQCALKEAQRTPFLSPLLSTALKVVPLYIYIYIYIYVVAGWEPHKHYASLHFYVGGRKVMFSQACVTNSVHREGGVYPSMHWGTRLPLPSACWDTHHLGQTPPG